MRSRSKRVTMAERGYRVGQVVDLCQGFPVKLFRFRVWIPKLGRITEVRRFWYGTEPLPRWQQVLRLFAWKVLGMQRLAPFTPAREAWVKNNPAPDLKAAHERAKENAVHAMEVGEAWEEVETAQASADWFTWADKYKAYRLKRLSNDLVTPWWADGDRTVLCSPDAPDPTPWRRNQQ